MSKRSRKKKRRAAPPLPSTSATPRTRVPRIGWMALVALVSAGFAYLGWQWFTDLGSYQPITSGACKQSNLLVITIDTLRADRLGSYGSSAELTPHLDRLATEGIRFDKVLAHVPMTLPSHTSIFSSMNPSAHGVHDNGTFRVDPSLLTLPRLLKDSGYRTAAFVGAFVLDSRFGLDQGFDQYDDDFGEGESLQSLVEAERPAEAVIASAEKWILESSQSPWFVWVHLFDPHAPYRAPAPFNSEHPEDSYGGEVAIEEAKELIRQIQGNVE